jgi:hypothetical protein
MAKHKDRKDRKGKAARRAAAGRRRDRRVYRYQSYAHDLQEAIGALLGLPAVLRPRRAGGWTPLLVVLAGLLMVYSSARTLTGRFGEACGALRTTCRGWTARSYQGYCKALLGCGPLLDLLDQALRARTVAVAPDRYATYGWCVLAADGSRFDLPRTRANRRYSPRAGKPGTGPQLYVTCLYHLNLGLLWDYRLGKGTASERHHLRAMLDHLPPQALIVADAGFVGYPLLAELTRRHIAFLVRAGRNVTVLEDLGIGGQEVPGGAFLWPAKARRRHHRPLFLRRIVLQDHGKTQTLLTNVLSSQRLSRRQARRLYAQRWGVEVLYRHLKQTLDKRRLLSRSPRQARLELRLAIQGLWLAGLLLYQARPRVRRPLPYAGALQVLQAAVARPRRRSAAGWRRLWAACRPDPYVRHRPKHARTWPHKKRERPPGCCRVRPATPLERRQAQRLTPLLEAA